MPSTGAVMEASIFIASMVATVSPAGDLVALLDHDGDDALERRRHLSRLRRVGLLGGLTSADTLRSRTLIGRSWPLIVAITVR